MLSEFHETRTGIHIITKWSTIVRVSVVLGKTFFGDIDRRLRTWAKDKSLDFDDETSTQVVEIVSHGHDKKSFSRGLHSLKTIVLYSVW